MSEVLDFTEITLKDLHEVGGKNASLGEMIAHLTEVGVQVPPGFATTVSAYKSFLRENDLEKLIQLQLKRLDQHNTENLKVVSQTIREKCLASKLPLALEKALKSKYVAFKSQYPEIKRFAVRSSATAEDLPEASFAGLQETYLNVEGIEEILRKIKAVFASLFTERAISYRMQHGFKDEQVAISVGIQAMVGSDSGVSGVMFTLDTESGFDQVIFITASYGVGELIVQGQINPDEYYLDKRLLANNVYPILSKHLGDKNKKIIFEKSAMKTIAVESSAQNQFALNQEDLITLGKQALLIEQHYGCPMDIEWAKDGHTGKLWIVQARPETIQSQQTGHEVVRYTITPTHKPHILAKGRSVGQSIGQGKVTYLSSPAEKAKINQGDILLADMTDPDWEPVMKKVAGIITNRGGRTCHAAIIARELGIPAVVGCGNATETIAPEQLVTLSCAEGEVGKVYAGRVAYEKNVIAVDQLKKLSVDLMMNIGNPYRAFNWQKLPNQGVGLARIEFIISNIIGIHPKACLLWETLDKNTQIQISQKIRGYEDPKSFFTQKLTEGIAQIASAFYPKPVVVRLSDFKSNEYANLIGGNIFEPNEENPMLGFRGAARYLSKDFEDCFALECEAIKQVRDIMGFEHVIVMIPFVRTLAEAMGVIHLLAKHGLERGKNNLKIYMMCEVPSNVVLAEQFLEFFDGFSIGSNDLTQMTLGIDRDSALLANSFNEQDLAVKKLLEKVIKICKNQKKYVGICGQGPSDNPSFAQWLVAQGIESLSLVPDSLVEVWKLLQK